MAEQKKESVIEVIQKMSKAGEPEDKIVKTLKDLGISEEKAKRLIVLGQADTFGLMKSEIEKIVQQSIELEKIKLVKFIETQQDAAGEKAKRKVAEAILEDLEQYEKDITGQSTTFRDQINENIKKVTELSDRVRSRLNELGEEVKQVQVDVDEFKLKGLSSRNQIVSLALMAFGIIFCLVTLFLYFTQFSVGVDIDSIIITIVLGLIGITMMFVATLI